jgi:cytochrome c peroxidase
MVAKAGGRVELGRRLFFDPEVGRSGLRSCSSCHLPQHGFSDPAVRSTDDAGATARHSQTILYSDLAPAVHWDGEFKSVRELAFLRLVDPRAGGAFDLVGLRTGLPGMRTSSNGPRSDTSTRPRSPTSAPAPSGGRYYTPGGVPLRPMVPVLVDGHRYDEAFRAAFGSPEITTERVAEAIAEYVASVRPTRSAFDRFAAGDTSALGASEKRGLALFQGKAGCARCHEMKGEFPTFTDLRFHATGVSWKAAFPQAVDFKESLGVGDLGRMLHTDRQRDVRSFKTPTLRDVALRPPYMHDGAFETLRDVVEYYADGCSPDPALDRKIARWNATEQDVDDLVAFLESLTGEERAGLAPVAWSARAERTRVRVLLGNGKPLAGLPLTLEAAGDPLPGGEAMAEYRHVRTDAEGWFEFEPFQSTHASVTDGSTLLRDLIPDTCRETTIRVPNR